MRRLAHLGLLAFLALMIAAQGILADTTLCREENGEVALEWSVGGRCQAPIASEAVHCLKDGVGTASDHCMQCIDVPLPSEKSAKSLSFLLPFAAPLVVAVLGDTPSARDAAVFSLPCAASVFDGARTIRLLI